MDSSNLITIAGLGLAIYWFFMRNTDTLPVVVTLAEATQAAISYVNSHPDYSNAGYGGASATYTDAPPLMPLGTWTSVNNLGERTYHYVQVSAVQISTNTVVSLRLVYSIKTASQTPVYWEQGFLSTWGL